MNLDDHEAMKDEGFSWIELKGGPKDGTLTYFIGTPRWKLTFVDPSVDAAKYKPGDLEHRYELREGPDNAAEYRWVRKFRRADRETGEGGGG